MKQYLDILKDILHSGSRTMDRTGVGTLSGWQYQMRFNTQDGFPLLTTKKVFTRGIIEELLWFIKGDTNIKYLLDKNVHIWDEWADENGDLGPVYGHQWRHWDNYDGTFTDQLGDVINAIKKNPFSRRLIVNSWNAAQIDKMALPPCHCMFHFKVVPDSATGKPEYLNMFMYQRSADMFLGVPFNIASYSLLLMMVAQVTRLKPGEYVHQLGDAHIYMNHIEQVKEQLSREPRALPIMKLNPNIKSIDDFTIDDFKLEGYDPHPAIKAPVAV